MPKTSAQTMAGWSPAATPRRVWPSMSRAFFAAIEISASRPATSPAPTAGPCIAETTIFEVDVEPDARQLRAHARGGDRQLAALLAHDDFEDAGLEAADFQLLVRGIVHALIL